MIQFADKNTKPLVRSMWKTVFGDKDEYIDLIFNQKYEDENTLIYFDKGKAVASLQMLPYTIRFYGKPVTFYYQAGLCTLPEYRNKGYMGQLISESFRVMQSRNICLSILVPAEDWLFGYYEKYGYVKTFDQGEQAINLDVILKNYSDNLDRAFEIFDRQYQQDDFIVLKTKDDLKTILEEYVQNGMLPKYNLGGMSRIIDAFPLLNLYAESNPTANFTIRVRDEQLQTNHIYKVQNGISELTETENPDLDLNQKLLTRLLFGYKIDELPKEYTSFFKKHNPVMNLMLE
ncbi:GNAT family N-acetyltransferase [Dysgonomonas sp. OttesenSCG-928-M03]|nr:GNAT family N-acetyltransferase [Dysgonomonas sp. OttesenSCG-928-M03]